MDRYLILARKRWDGKAVPMIELRGESAAIREAQLAYRNGGLNRVTVVDSSFKVVFLIERRCRCVNVQKEYTGNFGGTILRCSECKLVIPEGSGCENAHTSEPSLNSGSSSAASSVIPLPSQTLVTA